ncbi:DUF3097 domain-containing protein [Actinokineospora sp. 24-640]
MRSKDYGDALSGRARPVTPEVPAEAGLVVEEPGSGFCGAVVRLERGTTRHDAVVLEDRHGRHRVFPMVPAGFLLDGRPVTLIRPPAAAPTARQVSASGSVRVQGLRARTAAASRIWVEGVHDAELVELVWGHDLRVEGVVVEPLGGIDDLGERVAEFAPGPGRRLGVLVDHLVAGSKETRIAAAVAGGHVLVTGHPFVDVWQAVKPAALGIGAWPVVPRGVPWKDGVCAALGWGEPAQGWRRVRAAVSGFRDLEAPLVGAVERLIDFVTDH